MPAPPQSACGAWVGFGGAGARRREVLAKVGISFVSSPEAAANLADEDPGWNFGKVSGAATAEWNGLLDRMAVSGGTVTDRRTFYTALYHSLLFPSVFSDDDGRYRGFDHRVHTLAPGQVQYSNISEDDIYRSEVPLLATLLPGPTSQMVRSLLADASQTPGGFLPKWVIADNDAGQWDGDSADPMIADAWAFGARGFDLDAALTAMVHGATVPESGLVAERQNLAGYEAKGWVPQLTYDLTSYPLHRWGLGDPRVLDRRLRHRPPRPGHRATSEADRFRPAGPELAAPLRRRPPGTSRPGRPTGASPPGPAFQPAGPALQAQGVAQQGFEEGNAVQYTWDVPQDLAGLVGLMGGDRAAVAELDTFFTQLDATRYAPYDWAGNEPDEWAPFEYDYAGAPWRDPVGRAPHHDPAVPAGPGRRAGRGRPRGALVLVRVGRPRPLSRDPGRGGPGHGAPLFPGSPSGRGVATP